MKVRVATASSDGIVVNSHFGRAEQFQIIEADSTGNSFEIVETRHMPAICHGGEHGDVDMEDRIDRLKDCKYILVSRIGMRAEQELTKRGIHVYELPDLIAPSIEKLMKYIRLEEMFEEKRGKEDEADLFRCQGEQTREI